MSRFYYCGNLGPKYTQKSQNHAVIQAKAMIWKHIEGHVKLFDKKSPVVPETPSHIPVEEWNNVIKRLFEEDKEEKTYHELTLLKTLLKFSADKKDLLLIGKETDFRELISKILDEEKNITKKTSILKYISRVRSVLMLIGREHKYKDNEELQLFGSVLILTGNPMTKATQDYFVKRVKDLGSSKTEKHGRPVSMPLVYNMGMLSLLKGISEIQQTDKTKKIFNKIGLGMILYLLMHEPSRPCEHYNKLEHKHLYATLHKKVYLLTFAFLKPKSLAYFLENNLITKFVHCIWKGKHKKEFVERYRNTVPLQQNSLCLFVNYVISMRIMIRLNNDWLSNPLVFNGKKDWNKDLKKECKILGVEGLTFYSTRYAHAEEMNGSNVNQEVRRTSLGHSEKSNMNEYYANNNNKRVSVNNVMITIGCDQKKKIKNKDVEYKHVGGIVYFDSKFLDSIKDEKVKEEFIKITDVVTKFIEEGEQIPQDIFIDQGIATTDKKKHKITKQKNIFKDLKEIPVGFQVGYEKALIGNNKQFDKCFSSLKELFKPTKNDGKSITIWSFLQMSFGKWDGGEKKKRDEDNEDEDGDEENEDEDKDGDGDEENEIIDDNPLPMINNEEENVFIDIQPASKRQKIEIQEWDFAFDDISEGDIVAIYCGQKDGLSIMTNEGMYWIAKITKINIKKFELTGKFAIPSSVGEGKILEFKNKAEKVHVNIIDILDIYQDDDNSITIENNNIENIKKMINKRMHSL